jgi:hypothetical protein
LLGTAVVGSFVSSIEGRLDGVAVGILLGGTFRRVVGVDVGNLLKEEFA